MTFTCAYIDFLWVHNPQNETISISNKLEQLILNKKNIHNVRLIGLFVLNLLIMVDYEGISAIFLIIASWFNQ